MTIPNIFSDYLAPIEQDLSEAEKREGVFDAYIFFNLDLNLEKGIENLIHQI